MSDFTSPWQGYDFSGLSAALSRIQEITRPALEALQNIQSTLQPIVEALEQYKPKVEEIGQVLLHVSRRFSAIEKMGDAQFVFWDYMTEEFVDEIVDSENISKTLREQMLRDRFSKVNRTIDKTLSSAVMHKHNVVAELYNNLGNYVTLYDGIRFVGEIGSYVAIDDINRRIIAEIIAVDEKSDMVSEKLNKAESHRYLRINLIGEICNGSFSFAACFFRDNDNQRS